MGGIPTNCHGEVVADRKGTIVPGLMAIGEAACVSVHGANRLGTNSLLDLIVFGRAAALRAKEIIKPGSAHPPLEKGQGEETLTRFNKLRYAKGSVTTGHLRLSMQKIMQHHCAVFRHHELLARGIEHLADLSHTLQDIQVNDTSLVWNTDLLEALELENLMVQAIVTLHSAHYRTESRGAHSRTDFPQRDDQNWLHHSLCWYHAHKAPTFAKRPVQLSTSKDVDPIPLQERVY